MGRAERRKAERRNRIEDKKGKIYLTPAEVKKMKDEISSQAANFDVEVLLTCFAQVLHDEYGFGQKRILRALNAVDTTFGKVLDGELSVKEMKQRLEDEVAVKICCGSEGR